VAPTCLRRRSPTASCARSSSSTPTVRGIVKPKTFYLLIESYPGDVYMFRLYTCCGTSALVILCLTDENVLLVGACCLQTCHRLRALSKFSGPSYLVPRNLGAVGRHQLICYHCLFLQKSSSQVSYDFSLTQVV
jgi:hypothetical protein